MTGDRKPAPTCAAVAVLAFDFGTRRIGVAVGNTLVRVAHPLATIEQERNKRFDSIAELINEWRPAILVVGLPLHADGTEHAMTERARRFARQLQGRFRLAVEFSDERWTTELAQAALDAQGTQGTVARGARDQVAAQLILQSWLDQHERTPGRT
ncbi:MAG: Holliday junction resolvase RuvX [Betaproteobacteria bacterium]|nr:Holliday junction resolvase RuvX [Betaproteobacteria bacterium]MBA3775051.1 Holliday junction resolvase RuvX [Betaproteobacteria bacterium]